MAKVKYVDPKILHRVAVLVSDRLADAGVPHALIGGMAVATHGYMRATRDVDFLISRDDLAKLTGRPLTIGITERVADVDVDFVTPAEGDEFLESVLSVAVAPDTVPLAPIPALIFLKLRANRRRDQGDVVELIKRGRVNIGTVRAYLAEHADADVQAEFELLVLQADQEG